MHRYAIIAALLIDMRRGKIERENIEWNENCENAFHILKAALTKNPVLFAPDVLKEFLVQTHASLTGAGIVLAQIFEVEKHPAVYLSKKVSTTERNYSTIKRDGVKKLNYYFHNLHFILQTNHNP